MKKAYIALAVLSMAALLVSCQENEINGDAFVPEKGDVVFRLANNAKETKSSDIDVMIKGETFDLGSNELNNFYLEETIVDLNDLAYYPDTKGTPAYTENLGILYANDMSVYGDKGGFTTPATFENVENEMYPRKGSTTEKPDKGWRYHHAYATNPWPESGAVGFYLNMPAAPQGLTISSKTGGKFTISYTMPTNVADQKDILFAYRSMTKEEHDGFLPNGAPVLFNHALTGVKFAIANYSEQDKITIKSVSFKGLVGTATCEITPASESDYSDVIGTHSSTTESVVKWTIPETPDRSKTYSSGEFGAPVNYAEGGSFDDKGNYPASFSQAGNTNNLNKDDASQTFWFIPQPMTDDVKLTIVYTYGSTEEKTAVLDFGTVLKSKGDPWKAGELRTYTLKVDAVKVHIEDQVTAGGVKQGVAITNTGNTKAFIRATIIGNWCDSLGRAVFGFTDFIDNPGQYVEIPSWTVDNPGTGASFAGLPGTGWVRATDGYFYYTTAVDPGKIIGTAPANATNASDYLGNPLFTSYTPPTTAPDYQIAGKFVESHFVMEIATQAVNANNLDGTPMTWQEAWTKALGTAPQPKTNN